MAKKSSTILSQEELTLCNSLSEADEAIIREVLARAADKWSLWALSELVEEGPLRFTRLMERVEGISQKSLTATLRHLERDGLITRTVTEQVPIRVDYEATALGHELIRHVHPLWAWAARNLAAFNKARKSYDRVQARRVVS